MDKAVIGIDIGGTNIRAGIVINGNIVHSKTEKILAQGSEEEVLRQMFKIVDSMITPDVTAIGIGVPGLAINGVAYDVYNIPSWKEIALQQIVQQRYNRCVAIENDANCFALAEARYGAGRGLRNLVGLSIGTGLGCGIIINNRIYDGANGAAGEFGMVPYLDKYYEYYASGQFFDNVYALAGEAVFEKAKQGDDNALAMYKVLGNHLGNAVKTIIYTYNPPLIVLGGSLKAAYHFYEESMWQQIKTIELKKSIENFQIKPAALNNSALLGAASLVLQQ